VQHRVINAGRGILCCALAFVVSANASVIVQLKIGDGEGVTYRTGTRATRGLTVQVTDETGKPVDMAAVSFRLPDGGASGTFNSGLRTEIVTTGPDGRATVWGMRWNKTPGPVEIRVTATKDQARAGIVSTEYLSDSAAAASGGEGVFKSSHGGHPWLWVAAVAAAGAGVGAYLLLHNNSKSDTTGTSPVTGVSVGSPSIIVGQQ
jgi:hypothetical protein